MTKFCFISAMESHPWGGSEELWYGTALHLATMGHKISASIRSWPEPENQRRAEALREAGITVIPRTNLSPVSIHTRILRKLIGSKPYPHAALVRHLESEKPDLICVSNGNYADGLWAMNLAAIARIPYVSVIQANADFLWPSDDTRQKLELAYRQAKAFFCVSKANLSLLKDQLACDFENGYVVRNPFNVPYDASPEWPTLSNSLKLACVSRVEPDSKGHDLLFHALKSDTLKDLPICVSIFGKGRSEEGVKLLAKRLDLSKQVTFMGQVRDITEIWRTHHALVLPSRYEGLPLAIVEAMICSRPVITTNVSGNPELLEHGKSGFIADAPNVEKLSLAIKQAWDSRHTLQEMGRFARKSVLENVPSDPCHVFAETLESMVSPS